MAEFAFATKLAFTIPEMVAREASQLLSVKSSQGEQETLLLTAWLKTWLCERRRSLRLLIHRFTLPLDRGGWLVG